MSTFRAVYTARYRKNRRLLIKRGLDISKLDLTIDMLLSGKSLPPKFQDHPLRGNYKGFRECHVDGESDWLLIYKKHKDRLIIVFTATGTHDDLF